MNDNQLLFGKNSDQKSFWIVSDIFSCEDDPMETDGIVIQNSKVVSSFCTRPGEKTLQVANAENRPSSGLSI